MKIGPAEEHAFVCLDSRHSGNSGHARKEDIMYLSGGRFGVKIGARRKRGSAGLGLFRGLLARHLWNKMT